MAKDKFERTKPHVNVWAMGGLAQLGFSAVGVHQIVTGQAVTDPGDRALTAGILGSAQAQRSPGSEKLHFPVKLINATVLPAQGWGPWEVNLPRKSRAGDSTAATGIRQLQAFTVQFDRPQLQRLGFSALGAEQIATGQVIADPEDRSLAAEILTGAASPLIAKALCKNEVID